MAKKLVLCDTDVMINYWDVKNKRHAQTHKILENIGRENIALSAITKMELMMGATNKTDLAKTTKNLAGYNIVLLNSAITMKAFDLLQGYLLSHGLSLPDSIIASIAIITGFDLFTYNTKDYKYLPNLSLYHL